jgi:hypothetical protein
MATLFFIFRLRVLESVKCPITISLRMEFNDGKVSVNYHGEVPAEERLVSCLTCTKQKQNIRVNLIS